MRSATDSAPPVSLNVASDDPPAAASNGAQAAPSNTKKRRVSESPYSCSPIRTHSRASNRTHSRASNHTHPYTQIHQEHHSTGHVHEDAANRPQLQALVRRLNGALEPFFPENRCFKGWGEPQPHAYLPGCAIGIGCKTFNDLQTAKDACDKAKNDCGGVIASGDLFELRSSSDPVSNPSGSETSYPKIPCSLETNAVNVYTAFSKTMEEALDGEALLAMIIARNI
jgi:hypothetical protein